MKHISLMTWGLEIAASPALENVTLILICVTFDIALENWSETSCYLKTMHHDYDFCSFHD